MNSTIQKQSFQSAWKIILPPLLPLPITGVSVVCRTWHGCPSKPQILPPAHSNTHTNCRYLKCRERLLSHDCASSQTFLCIWPKLCPVLSNRRHRHEFRKQVWASTTRELQVTIPLLLLCALGCCHLCLCSEIRKATSTCREITVLLISGSSTSLYTCFLGSKCLCSWDRKYFMIFVQKQPIISKLKLQSLASISSVFFHWEV